MVTSTVCFYLIMCCIINLNLGNSFFINISNRIKALYPNLPIQKYANGMTKSHFACPIALIMCEIATAVKHASTNNP